MSGGALCLMSFTTRCIGVAPLWVGSGNTSVRRSPSTSLTRGRLKTFTPLSSTLPRSLNRLFTRGHLQRRACRRGAVSVTASTTLADLFTLLFAANPFSAAWASPWRWSSDEFEDGLAHGGQCRSRRRPVDSFFPALLF